MSNLNKIKLDIVLNAILVNENIRPAMLIQPQNEDEETGNDKKTKFIIDELKKNFPELIFSENYQQYQGIIVSKTKSYDGQTISLDKMGEILGYPCYENFTKLNRELPYYSIDVVVKEKNGKTKKLFANVCKDDQYINKFKTFAENASIVLKKQQYKTFLNGLKIDKIYVNVKKITPTNILIEYLIQNKNLEKDEIYDIQEILWNYGLSDKTMVEIKNNIQYNNPVHRGILIDWLLKHKYDLLSPFYPLQFYPQQYEECKKIIKQTEKDFVNILKKTRNI